MWHCMCCISWVNFPLATAPSVTKDVQLEHPHTHWDVLRAGRKHWFFFLHVYVRRYIRDVVSMAGCASTCHVYTVTAAYAQFGYKFVGGHGITTHTFRNMWDNLVPKCAVIICAFGRAKPKKHWHAKCISKFSLSLLMCLVVSPIVV